MDMVTGMAQQPALNGRGLMGRVVIHDQMHLTFRGHVGLDGIEEPAEPSGSVPALQLADHLAGLGVERGEQTCGSVTEMVWARRSA